jgi:hypothetical protein
MAAVDELSSKGIVVVDLTVSDHCEPAVAAHEWLVTTAHIDDRKPPNAYGRRSVLMDALVIGSPVLERVQDGA